jgi:hypothetical protein
MLKLHRDESDLGGVDVATYKFPTARSRTAAQDDAADSRHRLVAAQVQKSPLQDTFDGSACGVLHGGDDPDCIGRIVSSGQLVREIENTLDRMQHRLNDFREEMDRAFQFPLNRGDDDLPPAA